MPVSGLPQDAQFQVLQKFKGLNTKATRRAIDDDEFSWLENMIPIGDGNLRTVYGPSAAIYSAAAGSILGFTPFNITGAIYFHIVFLNNGAADVVNLAGGINHLFPAGTFSTGNAAFATQWGSKYLLILDQAKGYFIWDGTTTYFGTAGNSPNTCSLAPVVTITNAGTGYSSAPGVVASGGHGSGTSFQAVVANGSVVAVNILNAGTGYQPGDVVTLAFSGGGGSNAAATVTLMPTGLTGTDLEVFQSRVWIINGATLTFSAPASVSDFSITDGGGSATATDSVLRVGFFALRQASGFLYPIADSSIDVINNVVTGGSPTVTTFNDSNVDPQIGTVWRDTTNVFGRAIMLTNPAGVYGLYGGAAEKVSPALDGIFQVLSPGFVPSSAQALMFGIRVFIVLIKATDYLGVVRPMFFCWDGQKWFIASQNNNNIKSVATLYRDSVPQCWATDGTSLFQCFTTPSTSITKTMQSKLWEGKEGSVVTKDVQRLLVEVVNNTSNTLTISGTVDSNVTSTNLNLGSFGALTFINNSSGVLQFQNNSLQNLTFTGTFGFLGFQNINFFGKEIGVTLLSTGADFTIKTISLMYIDSTAY